MMWFCESSDTVKASRSLINQIMTHSHQCKSRLCQQTISTSCFLYSVFKVVTITKRFAVAILMAFGFSFPSFFILKNLRTKFELLNVLIMSLLIIFYPIFKQFGHLIIKFGQEKRIFIQSSYLFCKFTSDSVGTCR